MLLRVGVPHSIATAWLRAMTQATRVLQVGHHYSMPQASTTGVPEGDPVGTLAVALLGTVWINLIREKCSNTTAYSYADNFEYLTCDFQEATKGLRESDRFANAFRQKISYSKCWVYATDPAGRQQWTQWLEPTQCRGPRARFGSHGSLWRQAPHLFAETALCRGGTTLSESSRLAPSAGPEDAACSVDDTGCNARL